MKKIISLFLAVLLLLAMAPVSAFAAGETKDSFKLTGATVEIDGTEAKTVDIVFSGTAALTILGINGSCAVKPADGITLTGMTAVWEQTEMNFTDAENGAFVYADDTDFTGMQIVANAPIVTMTYTVSETVAAGTYPVTLTLAEYCNEASMTEEGVVPTVKEQTYTANIVVTEPSVATEDIFENKTGTITPATITAPANGWVIGAENKFTVSCEKACIVAYTDDNGATYHRLDATADGDAYSFTVTLTADMKFVVAIAGDLNNDGVADTADAMLISRSRLSNAHAAYLELSAINTVFGDINNDGLADSADFMLIYRSRLSDTHAAYAAISWTAN